MLVKSESEINCLMILSRQSFVNRKNVCSSGVGHGGLNEFSSQTQEATSSDRWETPPWVHVEHNHITAWL